MKKEERKCERCGSKGYVWHIRGERYVLCKECFREMIGADSDGDD
jgi:ribosomal protein S14